MTSVFNSAYGTNQDMSDELISFELQGLIGY